MIIVLLGASGSGKSTLETELSNNHGYKKIVSYTTRAKRDNEENGKDYYFISNNQFVEMNNLRLFAESDSYSQNRCYGTLKADYEDSGDKVVVLTPNGFRQLKEERGNENIFSALITSSLGTRLKRYVDRCGVDEFTFDDKNEICSRVERDYGMFLGVDSEVSYVACNNEGTDIRELAKEIAEMAKMYDVKEC